VRAAHGFFRFSALPAAEIIIARTDHCISFFIAAIHLALEAPNISYYTKS
jgi:hypothetical protein